MSHDVIRVLVIGPVFAGKSTLLSSFSRPPPDAAVAKRHVLRTVGCYTETTVHTSGNGSQYHVEWLEVGAASQFSEARSVFYRDYDGILAVFDASSERSFANVRVMLTDVAEAIGDRAEASAARAQSNSPPFLYSEEDGGSHGGNRRSLAGGTQTSAAAHTAKGTGATRARELLIAAALRRIPILLLANKRDLIDNATAAAAAAGDETWRHALSSGASRTKLDIRVRCTDARSVTICGITCRRPKMHRVVVEARVAVAVRERAHNISPLNAVLALFGVPDVDSSFFFFFLWFDACKYALECSPLLTTSFPLIPSKASLTTSLPSSFPTTRTSGSWCARVIIVNNER